MHRDDAGFVVEVKEIPAWEGNRVRDFLQNADADMVQNFDGEWFLVPVDDQRG